MNVDQINIDFSPESLIVLNIVVAIIMFGVALDITPRDFRTALRSPRPVLVGLLCQFVLLPALACGLTILWQPQPSIALGIILTATCPGGNFSNFLTHYGRGNAALSISMSSLASICSVIMTPLNIALWAGLNPYTAPLLLKEVTIDVASIFQVVTFILVLPLLLGMVVNHLRPALAGKLLKPFQMLSLFFLGAFIVVGLGKNVGIFLDYIGVAFWIVLITNALAMAGGYWGSRALRLSAFDARAVSFEVGIQNASFGLILVFNFFNGLGGAAIIVAWWGIWNLFSGWLMAAIWRKRPLQEPVSD